MKNQHIMICFFMIFTIYQSNAQRYDYQWAFGYGTYEEYRFGISLLDFNNGAVDVSYYGKSENYNLGFAGSFIDDVNGELYLHTNNCYIKDKYWKTISGDSLLTPTGTAETCTDGSNYGASQSSILLPDLLDQSLTYLIHKDFIVDYEKGKLYSNNLWITTIFNKVVNARHSVYNKTEHVSLRLTACPNRKKNGWWIVLPEVNTGVVNSFFVQADSFHLVKSKSIGITFDYKKSIGIGQAQFSPDGSIFAINTEEHGVLLYDFNNETGELSNFRSIPYPDSHNVAQGLCFSSNSRFIYVTTAENVYQIDLDIDNEVNHIGYYRSFDDDNWPIGLGMMFLGPDCKIYVSPGSTTYYLHVIKEPNRKGKACEFVQRIIELPSRIPHHLPNIPQYRYLTGCDSTISFPFVTSIENINQNKRLEYRISPNPVADKLTILFNSEVTKEKSLIIYNELGQIVKKLNIEKGQKQTIIDISELSKGLYYIQEPEKGTTSKIIKM